jgi:hypothetical protein
VKKISDRVYRITINGKRFWFFSDVDEVTVLTNELGIKLT